MKRVTEETTLFFYQMSSRGASRGGRGGNRGSSRGVNGDGRGGRGTRGGNNSGNRGGRFGFTGGNPEIVKPNYNFVAEFEKETTDPDQMAALPALIEQEKTLSRPGDPVSAMKRPGYGKVGIKTKVGTNFVKLDVSNLTYFYYHVTFPAEMETRAKVKNDLLEILISKNPFLSLKNAISHDGSGSIYSTKPIPIEKDAKNKFVFELDEWKGIVPSSVTSVMKKKLKSDEDPEIACTVEYIHRLSMDYLNNWVKMKDTKNIEKNAYIQALNVSLGYKIAKNKNVFMAGTNKFFFVDAPNKCQPFQKGLFLANGYFASIVPTFDNIMINIRPVVGAFFKSHKKAGTPMSVADLVADYFGETDLNKVPKDQILRQSRFFKGIKIMRTYLGHKSKPKVIFDISRYETANSYKFDCDGKETSVAKYFQEKYQMKLKYPDQPLVHLGGSNFIPMEACIIVPGQEFKGDIEDIRGVLAYATHRPHTIAGLVQKDSLPKITQSLDEEDQKRIGNKLVVVPSRILSAPTLDYSNTKINFVEKAFDGKSEKQKGSWDIIGKKFYKPVVGNKKLLVLLIENSRRSFREPDSLIKEAVEAYVNEVKTHGVTLVPFKMERVKFDFPDQITREVVNKAKPYKGKVDYVLSILPQKEKAIYAGVKAALDRDLGMLNQCTIVNKFTKQKFGKFDLQMYALMSMKACIKLGGSNHVLSKNNLGKLVDEDGLPALLLGADVTHPTNGSGTVSIASVVGSVDGNFNRFPGSISVQQPRLETIIEMSSMVVQRIVAYHKVVGKLPKVVLFYRDGVSVGQFNTILDEEVTAVRNAFTSVASQFNTNFEPKLTFITLLKNHSTRFFPLEKNAKNSNGKEVAVQSMENIMPGSIVERGVTSRSLYDFFLQSQQALQGTAIPGHYYVLYDENKWQPDELQQATYNLCSIFGRATKSVRVCPPAYYADLLCERATCFVQSHNLSNERDPVAVAKKTLGSGIHKDVFNSMIYI